MFKVVKKIEFCFGHRLLEYQGKCAHLHGHNGTAEIELASESLNSLGMVYDFHEVKKEIEAFLQKEVDHKMLLREDDPLVPILREQGEPVFVLKENPTVENIAKFIYEYAVNRDLPVVAVRLWENTTSFAEYSGGEG